MEDYVDKIAKVKQSESDTPQEEYYDEEEYDEEVETKVETK